MTSTPIPQLPLLAPWYRLVDEGDRLLLEHGQVAVALEGAAVRTFLPALLPLLDGTRTVDDLARRLGEPARPAIVHALETLGAHGVLTHGVPPAPGVGRDTALACAAAFSLAPDEARARADAASLAVLGSSPLGADVARLARLGGVGSVDHQGWTGAEADLVVVAPERHENAELRAWNVEALARGIPWLPVRPFDGRATMIGPLVLPYESACYECVLLRRASNLEYVDDFEVLERAPGCAHADAGCAAVASGLATSLALRWLLARDPRLPGALHVVETTPEIGLSVHRVLRVPRCVACSPVEIAAPSLPWHEARTA